MSGWQEIQGIQEGPGDNAEEVPWKDDGTLPLTDSGTLPFFLIDALEEVMSPGKLDQLSGFALGSLVLAPKNDQSMMLVVRSLESVHVMLSAE